jgi:hypothetical protein
MVDTPTALPSTGVVSVQATLDIDGAPVLVGGPVLVTGERADSGHLLQAHSA